MLQMRLLSFGIERARRSLLVRSALMNNRLQVERLYADSHVGSITQELCNGGILVPCSMELLAENNEW